LKILISDTLTYTSGINYKYFNQKKSWLEFNGKEYELSAISVNISDIIDSINSDIEIEKTLYELDSKVYDNTLSKDDIVRYSILYMGYLFYKQIDALDIHSVYKNYLIENILLDHFGFSDDLLCGTTNIIHIVNNTAPTEATSEGTTTVNYSSGRKDFISESSKLWTKIQTHLTDNSITSPSSETFTFYTKRFQFTSKYKFYCYIELKNTTQTDTIDFDLDRSC